MQRVSIHFYTKCNLNRQNTLFSKIRKKLRLLSYPVTQNKENKSYGTYKKSFEREISIKQLSDCADSIFIQNTFFRTK